VFSPLAGFTTRPFTEVWFDDAVGELANRAGPANTQTKYLASFLRAHSDAAKTMVREAPYVDRHYMEEHSAYYASSFRPVPNRAARIHLLSASVSQSELDELLGQAARGVAEFDDVRKKLEAIYLGFVVVRPIADAPIGRTILRPYGDLDERIFTTARRHTVHFAGIPLELPGVPFQQQEVAVGACATTAIWSALASASRAFGSRGPTPFAVTEAATRRLLNDRPLPAEAGLDLQQIVGAIHELGFAPYTMRASEIEFDIYVRCYLSSGFPVILIVQDDGERHAVTVVGFRRGSTTLTSSDAERPVISLGMEKVYVHEDRLGPYARMKWVRPSAPAKDATDIDAHDRDPRLVHEPYDNARYKYPANELRITHGIVPLYPKIRLSARGLLDVAASVRPWLRTQLGPEAEVRVELKFEAGPDYLANLMRTALQPAERASALTRLTLPRWVGIVRCMNADDEAFLDLVCDTTDIYRKEPLYNALLAMVELAPDFIGRAAKFVVGEKLTKRVVVI
jgi:hypothetical protein